MRTDIAATIRLADYRPTDYLIDSVDLDVSLDGANTRVRARLSLRPNPKGRPGAPLALDGDELNLVSISLDNGPLDVSEYEAGPQGLTLRAPPRRAFTLDIETALDPAANTKLMGLYRSAGVYCTQCEAEGFRRITYFLDRPDALSVYTTRIEADRKDAPVLLGNGNPAGSGLVAGTNRHYAIWKDPFPKPCYLFALVAGDLASIHAPFKTMSGRDVRLGIYVEKGKQDRAGYAMDSLIRSMIWDERVFGREYDLDVFNVVAVSDFNMGAMENKGLNVFNDKYVLASPDTATDADYANIEAIIAHEYFHNWTGDRITCRDWFQLCLKEGLTVFRDQEFSSDERSRPVKRIIDVRGLRAAQFPEDAGPLAHNVRPDVYREINNFYTATVYQKGAEVIRMLKRFIGDDAFRRGMDLYFERCDGTAATVEDFLACFAESSGRDLTQFKLWYEQAGTPVLNASGVHDGGARTYTVELSQTIAATPGQPTKSPMVIPVALGLVDPEGGDLRLDVAGDAAAAAEAASGVFRLTESSRRIVFRNVARRPALSPLRGFSAPVQLVESFSEDDLLTLLRHDSDSFNRWQAAQTLATRLMLRACEAARDGGDRPPRDARFNAALGALIAEALAPNGDCAFAALAIVLPGEADIAREIASDVDPDAILAARRALRADVGAANSALLRRADAELGTPGAFSPDAASAGRRALRAASLDLLCAGDPAEGGARASALFENADNMTDRIGALQALLQIGGEAREASLERFRERYRDDPLVIDKWLTLQAMMPEPGALARVRALMDSPLFSMANPNRVRALIGAFASGNATQFNRADGAGYDFVADRVLEIDPRNPQVAARLATAFRSWKTLEPGRRAHARAALERIAAREGLSRDVHDIATRSLV